MREPPNDHDLEWVREQIIIRARARKRRRRGFTSERPTRWAPRAVLTPTSHTCFNDADAWRFIADQAEAGAEIGIVALEKPPDCIGYVMLVPGGDGRRKIYIKVELAPDGSIIARSFHYSDY